MQSMTPPVERRRPAVVTVAGSLMLVLAVLGVIWTVVSLTVIGGVRDAITEQLTDQDLAEAASALFTVVTLVSMGFQVLIVVAFVLLGIFVLRGANPARITTWAVAGVFLLCGVCGLTVQGFGSVMPAGDPESEQLARAIEDAVPGWYTATDLTISIVQNLALLVIIILLALPPANAFFAKPVPLWQPPMGYGGPPMAYPPQHPGAVPPPGTQPGAQPPGTEPPAYGPPAPGPQPPGAAEPPASGPVTPEEPGPGEEPPAGR